VYPGICEGTAGHVLHTLISVDGYGRETNLYGCLLATEHVVGRGYRCPYIDSGSGEYPRAEVTTIDDVMYLRIGEGGNSATETDGFLEGEENTFVCDCCDCRCSDDDRNTAYDGDASICDDCISESYTFVNYVERYGYTATNTYVRDGESIYCESDGEYYYDNEATRSHFNIIEINDKYYTPDDDDVVWLEYLDGYVLIDVTTVIDHEYQGHDRILDVHVSTLSDGTTCHDDNAASLQADIDLENQEETPKQVQVELELTIAA
jgi:hypothetical protein